MYTSLEMDPFHVFNFGLNIINLKMYGTVLSATSFKIK